MFSATVSTIVTITIISPCETPLQRMNYVPPFADHRTTDLQEPGLTRRVTHRVIYISHVSHALHEGAVARRRALHFEQYNEDPSRRTRYCSMIVERLQGVVP